MMAHSAVAPATAEHEHSESWALTAGTALSGLGMTLNGINSLYGLAAVHSPVAAESAPTMVGSVASGAVALFGGWMAASKLSAVGGMSMSPVGIVAGVAYASIGLLYFMYTVTRLNTSSPPRHSPVHGSGEAKLFPSPDWLSTRVLNWGVMGRVGVGKSTLINALRGLHPRSSDAAPVGIGHTTRRPKPYNFVGDVAMLTRNMARLWDLPGAGTKDWPCASYVRDAGLRHFDGVIFVTCDSFSELEAALMRQLQEFQVPYYIVRNKVDQDVANNAEDNNCTVEESLAEIRYELFDRGCDPARTFLTSAKNPQCADYEFGLLLRTMATDVCTQRGELPEFVDEAAQSSPMLKDATAFASRSLGELHPLKQKDAAAAAAERGLRSGPSFPGLQFRHAVCGSSGSSCDRAASCSAPPPTRCAFGSSLPGTRGARSTTPPPTRLYTKCDTTPEPVVFRGFSAGPRGMGSLPNSREEWDYQEPGFQTPCFAYGEPIDSTMERLQL